MNISDVINDIKLSQGLNAIALPYNEPVENVIAEILKMTVREFSDIVPYERESYCLKKDLRSPNEFLSKMDIYLLPPDCTRTKVKSADAEMASSSYQPAEASTNAFTVGTPFLAFGSYYPQDILNSTETGAAINKFAGVSSQQPTSKYLGYNKIQLFNFPKECLVHFTVSCEHDPSLDTIKDSYYLSFVELATLDVQRTLYSQIKNMQNVGSAYKEIQLKIEEWSGAENAQRELIKDWTSKFHLDNLDLVQFF